jgi:hypothetical protein
MMSAVKFVAVAAAAGLAYLVWHKHQLHVETAAIAALMDERGFIEFALPEGAKNNEVLIVAAQNCPHEGAVRADDLAREMAEHNIRYRRSSHISFSVPQDADVDMFSRRSNAIMNGKVPIVFVNGRVKSNPGLDEVIAEYVEASR